MDLTPTQLIREAYFAGGPVQTPKGEIEHADHPDAADVEDALCWLCGGGTGGKGVPTKKAIKDTFTDHPYARAPNSKSICLGCGFVLGNRPFRNYSLLADKHGLRHPSRSEWRDILLDPPEPPFVAAIAVSGQKHLAFKSVVSYDREAFVVLLEEMPVPVRRNEFSDLLDFVEPLLAHFTKTELETGNYSQSRVLKFGLGRWQEVEERLAKVRGSRLFQLDLFVAQKPEEVEETCTTDSTPKTSTLPSEHSSSTPSGAAVTKGGSRSTRRSGAASSDSSKAAPSEQLTLEDLLNG